MKNKLLKSKFSGNVILMSVAEAVAKLSMFWITYRLVNLLGAKNFGEYNLLVAMSTLVLMVSDWGLNTIVTRELATAEKQKNKVWSNLFSMRLWGILLVNLAVAIFGKGNMGLWWATIFYSTQSLVNLFLGVFNGLETGKNNFWLRICYYTGLVGATILAGSMKWGLIDILKVYSGVGMVAVIIGLVLISGAGLKTKIVFDKKYWRMTMLAAWPLFTSLIVTTTYNNADTLLIGHFFEATKAGYYQAAYKIFLAFQAVYIIHLALFAKLSIWAQKKNTKMLVKATEWMVWGGAAVFGPMVLGISALSPKIMTVIYGAEFVVASRAMVILVAAGIVGFYRWHFGNILLAAKREKEWFYVILTGTVANVAMNAILLPHFGFEIGAWAMLAAETLMLIVAGLLAKREFN